MKKIPLADVLWTAANKHMCPTDADRLGTVNTSPYSCDAVLFALQDATNYKYHQAWCKATDFLAALGCPTGSYDAFAKTAEKKRQGVRYMWLLLAMHVAEDEQIMVEVA